MSPLSLFILFIITITFIIARYTLNGLKESTESSNKEQLLQNNYVEFWKNAETTNGRLAMMGLLALVINYGIFGWIIPGIF